MRCKSKVEKKCSGCIIFLNCLDGPVGYLFYLETIKLCSIQADQSGTIVEIVAEDAKSVSVDTVSIF